MTGPATKWFLGLLALVGFVFATQSAELTPAQRDFFEKKIRPVLVEKCLKCHSAEAGKTKGGLSLDSREGARKGGDTGPAIVPGDARQSLLLSAIHYTKKDLQMPPEKEGGKLPDAVIKDFEQWISMGAPDPREAAVSAKKEWDYEKAKAHWAYQPPKKSAVPTVKDTAWPRAEMDHFLLAALEAKNLKPVADAGKMALLRRVHFDLIGLPPTFAEINAFLDDTSAESVAHVVDRLLASTQFGERWGRHWLDVARYAESTGKDVNVAYPHAWRYRDYTIAAFNTDKPFDQFIREQVAGDLLPAKDDRQRAEQLVATGFLALGPKSVGEQNPRQYLLDVADEQIDALSQAVLATTIACARCHDHKFDPITQREYYALAGIFTSTETRHGTAANVQNRHPGELNELPAAAGQPTLARKVTTQELAKMEMRLIEQRQALRDMFTQNMQNRGKADPANDSQRQLFDRLRIITETGRLEAQLKLYDATGVEKALAMGAAELPARREAFGNLRRVGQGRFGGLRPPEFSAIADCALYTRGDVGKPTEKVPRGFPAAVLPVASGIAPAIPPGTSGRLQLAQSLTDARNPLTARVYVNRVWGWLFGRGLVDSPDNFGNSGALPSNQALLDTLSVRFMENGWSTKKLIREIVLSRAYQLSTAHDEKVHTADPDNALHWRMTPRRLDAECIRDAMLALSGELDLKAPLASAIARVGDVNIGGPRFFGLGEAQVNTDVRHRSVYLPVARDLTPDALEAFDFPESSLVTGLRETTSVASQALFMMNSEFTRERAAQFGLRLQRWQPQSEGADAQWRERISVAYWLAFARSPTDAELLTAQTFFDKFAALPAVRPAGRFAAAPAGAAVWTSFCRALMASAEFRHLN
ncbi:MAG: DUF1549 domain-containing protein [Pedosphaera sp.]|nr:DUF1549 domain-containing protein [Pedosphaera sp.]MSU43598.1 DUF1549 domain-containing protein [Pedosphaera sp.]